MTPAVTQAEKDKRRRKHVTARQQRGKAGIGNQKPLPPAKPGADEKYKEKKIGVIYNQDKTLRHGFATEACCKTLTLRLKRPGMKWDNDNAASMMNLIAMRESGQWSAYWQKARLAA